MGEGSHLFAQQLNPKLLVRMKRMAMIEPEQWRRLSPYLDEAMEMSPDECSVWLRNLRDSDPEVAGQLEQLVKEHHRPSQEGFLVGTVFTLPPPGTLAGKILGAYRLLSPAGSGGMSSVWLAERIDGRFERQVAVKFLNIALLGHAGERRFRLEGKILGSLTHPNIAELLDAGISEIGQPYLVLEHVDGDQIDSYCDRNQLDLNARIGLFLKVLAAVAQAHANLVVHRDLKPSNVLVRNDGQVKLLDFGIAKLLESEDQAVGPTQLTMDGHTALTPYYAAPEQLRGDQITTATDIYALGCLLYILLTGRHPSGPIDQAPADLIRAIVSTYPARPSDIVAGSRGTDESATMIAANRGSTPDHLRRALRGDLDTIVLKALRKGPRERYISVDAFADDLQRYLEDRPIRARPDAAAYRIAKFVRRNRVAVALASVAALAIIIGAASTLVQIHIARKERDFAQRQLGRSAALNEFHRFLLSDAAPSGRPLSVHELLNRAERIVAQQDASDDPNRVELMISIGRQYLEQDDARNARRLLENAYNISRGMADPAIRSSAACVLAASLARDEEIARARALFQEGMRSLPVGPQYALERMSCLQEGSEVALESNEIDEGLNRAREAQRILQQSPFDSEALEMHVWMDLAKAYSAAGQHSEALAAFNRATALLVSQGRDRTGTAAVLFNDWAIELEQTGRPLEAEKAYRRAIDIMRNGQTEKEVSPIMLNNYARSLREVGRLPEAQHYAELAYANAVRLSHQLGINQSLLERARIYTKLHDPARAATMLATVEPRLQQSLPAGHYAFAALASAKAFNALEQGNAAASIELANQAVSMDEDAIKAGKDGASILPILLTSRAEIELAAQHSDQAVADASRALDLLRNTMSPGMFSSDLGHAYFALGRAKLLQGRRDEAHAAFQSAFEQLQPTVGADCPDTASAKRQMSA